MGAFETIQKARRAERNSDWDEAARLWRRVGRKEDADACQLIYDSIVRGDSFRLEVSQNIAVFASDEDELRRIYNNHY